MANLKVTNKCSDTIEVSVNTWGSGGSTGYFHIKENKSENWDREDPRGFTMSIGRNSETKSYLVKHNDELTYTDNYELKDADGKVLYDFKNTRRNNK